jgi:hypothetical protein
MLKKLLLALAFLSTVSTAFAQQVVTLNPQASTFVVVPGSPISQYQNPGIAYVFPMQPQNAVTITVKAGGVAADTLSVQTYCTTDPTDAPANFIQWAPISQSYVGDTTALGYSPTAMNLVISSTSINFSLGRRQIVQTAIAGAAQCAILLSGGNAGTDLLSVTASVSPATPFMFPTVADPCLVMRKFEQPINIVAAGNSQLVALTSGRSIYLCGYSFTLIGASQTMAFASGTAGSCSAVSNATGGMGDGTVAALAVTIDSSGTVYTVLPVSQPLCAVTTGTTVNIQGHLYYVFD